MPVHHAGLVETANGAGDVVDMKDLPHVLRQIGEQENDDAKPWQDQAPADVDRPARIKLRRPWP